MPILSPHQFLYVTVLLFFFLPFTYLFTSSYSLRCQEPTSRKLQSLLIWAQSHVGITKTWLPWCWRRSWLWNIADIVHPALWQQKDTMVTRDHFTLCAKCKIKVLCDIFSSAKTLNWLGCQGVGLIRQQVKSQFLEGDASEAGHLVVGKISVARRWGGNISSFGMYTVCTYQK